MCEFAAKPPLRCICPEKWYGDRCERRTPPRCDIQCNNGGKCELLHGVISYCVCKDGFMGFRCQHCTNFECGNYGTCVVNDGNHTCSCSPGEDGFCPGQLLNCPVGLLSRLLNSTGFAGYSGERCQFSICGPHGQAVSRRNSVKCDCHSGYSGDRCEINQCDGLCQNGGTCQPTSLECDCPPEFTGKCPLNRVSRRIINNYIPIYRVFYTGIKFPILVNCSG